MKKYIAIASTVAMAVASLALPFSTQAGKTATTCQTIQSGKLVDSKDNLISTGFDKWGYNYEAHLFNGWYGNYSRPDVPVTSGDLLQMKWNDAWLSSQDCATQGPDQGGFTPGFDNKLDRHYPTNSYIGSGAWLTNHASGTYNEHWDVTGTYVWTVLGTYVHDLTLTQDSSGNITGTGGWPAATDPYATTETITGNVSGNVVTLTTTYNGPYNPGYTATIVGTIQPDGSIVETDGPWPWVLSGVAHKDICTWDDFIKIVAVPTGAHFVEDKTNFYGEGVWYTDESDSTVIGPSIWGDFAVIQEVSSDPCGGMHDSITNFQSQVRSGLGHW